jgi:hypothetical protein
VETAHAKPLSRPVFWTAAFTTLSWLGEYIHNRQELPQLSILSPENSIMGLIALALFLTWLVVPYHKLPPVLLLALGLLHLIGGAILSVLPLGFLPFVPEQSFSHYLAHIVYGAAQFPLVTAMLLELRRK